MPRPKQLARPPKKQKQKPTHSPQTVDEFQEAADAHEGRGGKWRAGDSAKSGRAFVCALEVYDAGLQRYPRDFDLAYNKARLQLEIAQQPALVAHIGLPLIDLLQETLASHRYALSLNASVPDLLFNTSQVLMGLAEQISDADRPKEAIPLLHEALELLSSCLSTQQMKFEQHRADFAQVEHDEDGGGVAVDPDEMLADGDDGSDVEEQSATVEVPLTAQDLLDTVDASLHALATLVGLVEPHAVQALGDMAATLSETQAPTYLNLIDSREERAKAQSTLATTRALFVAALADAQYTASMIDLETYRSRLEAFNYPGREDDGLSLASEAEARTELVLSVLARFSKSPDLPVDVCWAQLSQAQDLYARAAKLSSSAQVYLSRGDTEMLRHRLAALTTDASSSSVRKNAPLLAQNAQTYYRGAMKLAGPDDVPLRATAERRLVVIGALRDVLCSRVAESTDRRGAPVQAVKEAFDEGLITQEWAERIAA